MRWISFLVLTVACMAIPGRVSAQIVDSTVCDILADPQSFDGKLVRIKGTVIAGFDEFAVKGSNCNQVVNAIWLAYPQDTKGKAGPAALVRLKLAKNNPTITNASTRVPVKLDKNKDFKDFDNFLSTPGKASGLCPGCMKNTVSATLVGRLDGSKVAGLVRDSSGKVIGVGGFGNLNRYSARLVLQSVSDVSPQEIDYAKGPVGTSESSGTAGRSFTPGVPAADQAKRAIDAFGAPGDDNGVMVGFSGANELAKDDEAKSNGNSPDGVIFDVVFDERLKGSAMQFGMIHTGSHIADIRNSAKEIRDVSLYGSEFRAWQASVLEAISLKANTLTLPGGFLVFDRSWPNSDLGKNVNAGIAAFLENWASLTNPPN